MVVRVHHQRTKGLLAQVNLLQGRNLSDGANNVAKNWYPLERVIDHAVGSNAVHNIIRDVGLRDNLRLLGKIIVKCS